jgi:hypothetical protein
MSKSEKEFEGTKGVARIRQLNDRQHNFQTKKGQKDKQ